MATTDTPGRTRPEQHGHELGQRAGCVDRAPEPDMPTVPVTATAAGTEFVVSVGRAAERVCGAADAAGRATTLAWQATGTAQVEVRTWGTPVVLGPGQAHRTELFAVVAQALSAGGEVSLRPLPGCCDDEVVVVARVDDTEVGRVADGVR